MAEPTSIAAVIPQPANDQQLEAAKREIERLTRQIKVHVEHLNYKNGQLLEMENRIFLLQAELGKK